MSKCLRYEDVYGPIAVNRPAWNGGAVFIEPLVNSGYYSFRISRSSVGVVLGLASDPTGEWYTNIQHGIMFSRGRFRIVESSVPRGDWANFTDNHTFHILREGSVVRYYQSSSTGGPYGDDPGNLIYTSQIPSYGTIYLDASLFATNDTVLSASYSGLSKSVSAAGDFVLQGQSWTGYSGVAEGVFSLEGLASDTFAQPVNGTFSLAGEAVARGLTSAHGGFRLIGLTADYPYAHAEGSFSLVGEAYSAFDPGYSEAKGLFQVAGEAKASRYIPSGASGYFTLSGKGSESNYGEAEGQFSLPGYAHIVRPAYQNYFDVRLHFTDIPQDRRRGSDAVAWADVVHVSLTYKTGERVTFASPTSARVDLSALFSDQFTLNDPVRFAVHQLLAESVNLADLAAEDIYRLALAAEALQVSEAVSPVLSVGATAADTLISRDRAPFALGTTLSDAATLTDTSAASRRIADRLREALGVSEDILPTLTIAQTLLETLIAEDIAAFVRQATASEVLALADELTSAIIAQLAAPEALSILDEVSSSLVVMRTAAEALTLDESGSIALVAQLLAGERLAFIGRLPLGEEVFSAWVLNTDTLGATSYTQFPMLALATHQGKTYGLTETGLYELTGETDDGEPIPAAIETGDLNFALHQDKNVPRAYLYLWAEGTMRLRTISSKRGCREEAWYEVTPMTGDDEQARIVRMARGVRGTTWQFRIENVDGCDFDLRGAEVLPVVLNKRGART